MEFTSIIIGFITGLLLCVLVYIFIIRKKFDTKIANLDLERNNLSTQLALGNAEVNALRASLEDIKNDLVILKEENKIIESLRINNATLSSQIITLDEKLKIQKENFEEIKNTTKLEFQKLATEILEDKSQRFTQTNNDNINKLLEPLGKEIKDFKEKVDKVYIDETKERSALKEGLNQIVELNNKLSEDVTNFANALRGQSKAQGNFGELILDKILEGSGLVKERDYFTQATFKGEEGNTLKPDVVIKLHENRNIIIDSKVSLTAYDRYSQSENPEDKSLHLSQHIASIYTHIDQLSGKNYEQYTDSLDFIMMFLPIEPAFIVALQNDANLWEHAYKKKIVLISPTNLMASLKLINYLWSKEKQNQNSLEIARQGKGIYDKIAGFLNKFEVLGNNISKVQSSYTDTMNSLKEGNGNIVNRAIKLQELGISSEKSIAPNWISNDDKTTTEDQPVLPTSNP
jgi:DNA recombination protein RmuC